MTVATLLILVFILVTILALSVIAVAVFTCRAVRSFERILNMMGREKL